MANEITFNGSLSCLKASIMAQAIGRSVANSTFTMAGNYYSEGSVLIGTSATAFPLGQVTAPHWAYFCNLDATNYCTIRNGSGGTDLIQLQPGESAFVPLLSTSVPYGVAHSASVQVEYLILSA